MEIRATTGRTIREMPDGMYYFSNDDRILMSGIRLNEPTENDIHKLGWLRFNGNTWTVRNGIIKITDAQVIDSRLLVNKTVYANSCILK